MVPRFSAAAASMAGCAAVSSRSMTCVATLTAPRVRRSAATELSLSALRATRNNLAPRTAKRRSVASAIAEVAPRARTFVGILPDGAKLGGHSLPEGGIEGRIDVTGELLPLWIESLELMRGHPRVFGWIHAAAV